MLAGTGALSVYSGEATNDKPLQFFNQSNP